MGKPDHVSIVDGEMHLTWVHISAKGLTQTLSSEQINVVLNKDSIAKKYTYVGSDLNINIPSKCNN